MRLRVVLRALLLPAAVQGLVVHANRSQPPVMNLAAVVLGGAYGATVAAILGLLMRFFRRPPGAG